MACPIAIYNSGVVLVAAFLSSALSLEKAFSMAFLTPVTLWAGKLSMMTTSPNLSSGASSC